MWTRDDWARLARRLKLRRYELGYVTFKDFIAERDINYRMAWDAEHADGKGRTSFTRRAMTALLDPAYGYVRGEGCENILDGMEPVALPGTPGGPPEREALDLSAFPDEDRELIADAAAELAKILRKRRAEAQAKQERSA